MDKNELAEWQQERRRRAGLPTNAGNMSVARFDDSMALNEHAHSQIREKFGHILGGALKHDVDRFDGFDARNSAFHTSIPRLDGGMAAMETKRDNSSRRIPRRGPQQNQQPHQEPNKPKFTVPLESFAPVNNGSEMGDLAKVEAMFGGGSYSSPSYRGPEGRLLPDRSMNTTLDMDAYAGSAPYNPMNQILNKVAARGASTGLDYRDIESRRGRPEPVHEDRYLSGAPAQQDPRLMQEMAYNMAQGMIEAFMKDHKGKKYFKEVKTNHQFDKPTAKLVEIDGKLFRMDLTPVKLKKRR